MSRAVDNASFAATTAITDNDIWAVEDLNQDTSSQQPLAVHFDGTSWSVVPTLTLKGRASFSGVSAVASTDVWAVGAKDISSTGTAQPLIEHWDGASWSLVPNPSTAGNLQAIVRHCNDPRRSRMRRLDNAPRRSDRVVSTTADGALRSATC
jgi:hypothetical protein